MRFANRREAGRELARELGTWYDDFSQTSDEEVRHLLHAATTAA